MSAFDRAIEIIKQIHESKSADYNGNEGEFYNFESAGRESNTLPIQVIEGLIAIKNDRRKSLEYSIKLGHMPNHESLMDTLLDRAVYSIIRYAYHLEYGLGDNVVIDPKQLEIKSNQYPTTKNLVPPGWTNDRNR